MGELVRQLLELSHAEGRQPQMAWVDLSRTVTGEALAFETLAFEQQKRLRCDIEDGLCLNGNAGQLTQLVSILLDNAVRHATGSDIALTLKRQGHTAVLTTVNECPELSQEQLDRLFERFYRADEARSGDTPHYGLGLSIARAVAVQHGGGIRAAWADGRVRFTVTLPLRGRSR